MSLNLNVERNGVNKTLVEGKFGKKNKKNFGKSFYFPTIEPPILSEVELKNGSTLQCLTNIADLLWFGLKDAATALTREARGIFQDIYLDNINETTGLLNEENMMVEWSQFTAGVEKLKDIIGQISVYVDEQQSIINDDSFGATEDGTPATPKTARAIVLENRMIELAALIQPLKISKAALDAKYAERVAKRQQRQKEEEEEEKATTATK